MTREWINRTHVGDCRELLAEMGRDGVRVQTCVTSPPYFGLRDYGTGSWQGGEATCEHFDPNGGHQTKSEKQISSAGTQQFQYRQSCGLCGAIRTDQQIGLESSPGEYVDQIVAVFRAVRDVLADDGTLWLNIGDSYAGGGNTSQSRRPGNVTKNNGASSRDGLGSVMGCKSKDLLGIPWRVAFALQADGWYLRSDIIWHKPNPMPESVTDRPTKAHEYLFLCAKSARYYYDAAGIMEASTTGDARRPFAPGVIDARGNGHDRGGGQIRPAHRACIPGGQSLQTTRNRRTVWTIPTAPFDGAHFACFPRALIEPCIIAGARPGDVVLDPFMGSGTTGQVATDLGRGFIGCELNREYVELELDHRKTTQGMPW